MLQTNLSLISTKTSSNLDNSSPLVSFDDMISLNSTNASSRTLTSLPVYRKVRPEPINERTLVSSVVGFLQDVVGADTNKQTQSSHNAATHKQSSSQSQLNSHHLANEIKEQIEWLHFENYNLLDSSKNSNLKSHILLVIGYKTGFSIWTIDVF